MLVLDKYAIGRVTRVGFGTAQREKAPFEVIATIPSLKDRMVLM